MVSYPFWSVERTSSAVSVSWGRRARLRCRCPRLLPGDDSRASRAKTASELAHSGDADNQDQGGTSECGHQQGDGNRHVPGRREEFNADRAGVLG